MAAELFGKRVELIRDMLPTVRRVAALGNAADPFSKPFLEQVRLAGRTTAIEIAPAILVRDPNEVDETFATMKKEGTGAVVVQGSLPASHILSIPFGRA